MKKIINQTNGITLIALVVTIIVLLILAGISIMMLSGNNGILQRAGEAKTVTDEAQIKEQIKLIILESFDETVKLKASRVKDNIEKQIKGTTVIGNDFPLKVTTQAGQKYIIKSNGEIEERFTIDQKKTKSGEKVIALSQEDTTEIEDNLGNIVKVPKGFGIAEDSGINVEQGIVIEDAMHEGTTKGSQFVWVPVGEITKNDGTNVTIQLGRYQFNKPSDGTEIPIQGQSELKYIPTTDSNSINTLFYEFKDDAESQNIKNKNYENKKALNIAAFIESTIKNGGYYIARYEAGINLEENQYVFANYEMKEDYSGIEPTIMANVIARDGTVKPLSIKGKGVWNAVTQGEASTISKNMYNISSDKITSDLINSYAWDTAISFIEKCSTNNNYANQKASEVLSTTGNIHDDIIDIQCNIYDMAGNVSEWTTETGVENGYPCVCHGGSYMFNGMCVNSRLGTGKDFKQIFIGFRTILYL